MLISNLPGMPVTVLVEDMTTGGMAGITQDKEYLVFAHEVTLGSMDHVLLIDDDGDWVWVKLVLTKRAKSAEYLPGRYEGFETQGSPPIKIQRPDTA